MVDDADVDRIVNRALQDPKLVAAEPEARGEVGYRLALVWIHEEGFTKEYQEALAEKVRQRLWWRHKPSN